MNGKHYLPHQTSILKLSARVTVLGLIIVTILLDLLPTVGYFGWIPAMIFMYFERKSLYIKYHATQILAIELIKVSLSFALLILSISFDFPYYTGEYGADSFRILLGGYLDLGLSITSVILLTMQAWFAWKYQEFKFEGIRNYIYKMMKKDPNFDVLVKYTPLR